MASRTDPVFHSIRPRSRRASASSSGSVVSAMARSTSDRARSGCGGDPGRHRGREQVPGAVRGLRAEVGGTGPRRRGGLVTTASPGPFGRFDQVRDDRLVRFDHRRGAVPRPAVGVLLAGQRGRERGMDARGAASLRCGAVHRGADQRVSQRHLVFGYRDQTGLLDLFECAWVRAQPSGCLQDGGESGGVVGGRDEQEQLGVVGEPAGPVEEDALDGAGDRKPTRQRRTARPTGRPPGRAAPPPARAGSRRCWPAAARQPRSRPRRRSGHAAGRCPAARSRPARVRVSAARRSRRSGRRRFGRRTPAPRVRPAADAPRTGAQPPKRRRASGHRRRPRPPAGSRQPRPAG